MNLTRLMALGILARSGPSHGHHIRRVADLTDVGEWGGVSVGALYRELRAMEREGLVEATRTEKVGNRPERTVYAITAEGQLELTTLREQAIKPLTTSGPDPLGVALLFAADGVNPEDLRRTLRARREMLAIWVAEVSAEREGLIAKGYLDVLAAAVMQRAIMSTEAEIRWHDDLDATLAGAGGGTAGPRAAQRGRRRLADRPRGAVTPVGSRGGGSFELAAPHQTPFEITAGASGGPSADEAPAGRPPGEAPTSQPAAGRSPRGSSRRSPRGSSPTSNEPK